MASTRQTIGDLLGEALTRLKRRARDAYLAARLADPDEPLTAAELPELLAKVWAAFGATFTPVSPDDSILIGTQNDANGDPQLTLRAVQSSVVLTSVAPFALYQFWRGETYGPKDASGNKFDLSAVSGGATYADLLSYGQGAKFAGGYLHNTDTSGAFQDLGDMSAFLSFQLDALPAEGTTGSLFAIDGNGSGDNNCLLNAYITHAGGLGTGHETGSTWHGYSPTATLVVGRLYTLGIVRTSTGVSVYLNGALLGTGEMPAADGGSLSTLYVGGVGWLTGNLLAGSVASLAFFHGALSGDDMKLLHRNEVFRWGSRPGGGGAPTAHASSHQPGGSDAMAVDAAAATGSLRTIGTGALQACAGNDSRLSNSRAPTSHASTHAAGQSDALPVTEGMLSLADNTTSDASSEKHGLLPKLPNDTNKILHGDGVWAALAEAGLNLTDLTTGNLTTARHGFAPKAPNDATRYLDGSGAWSVPYTSAFTTAYSVDFTALATQNLLTGGDGNKTIDGKTWVLANSGGLQSTYLQDGSHSGLYMRASTTSTNNGASALSAGALYVSLSTLAAALAQYQLHREILIWVRFSQPRFPAADNECAQVGVFAGTPYTAAGINRISIMYMYASGLIYRGHTHVVLAGTQTGVGGSTSVSVVPDVFVIRIIDGVLVETYYGNSVTGAFPDKSTLVRGSRTAFGTTGVITKDNWYLTFSVFAANTAGLADILWQNLKIEYK